MADSPWDMLSAIGTVTAVVVALGGSGHAAWKARKVDDDHSELVAAKMLSPLSELQSTVSYLHSWFCSDDEETAGQYMSSLIAIQKLEAMAGAISTEDLYPLLHLKNHAAKRTARALGLIHIFSSDAIATLMHQSWSDVIQHETYHKKWAEMLSEIQGHLDVAVSTCKAAASTGAPRPTVEEIHGQ